MIYDVVQPLSPPEPSVSVQAANNAAATINIIPTNPALASTAPSQVPPPQGAVPQLPQYISKILVSQQAVTVSTLSNSEKQQLGVLQTVSGVTLNQLSMPGQSLKPGSGAFLQSLQQQAGGLSFTRLASKTLMTGQYGVTTSQALLNNVTAQTNAITSSIQSATIGLKNSGVLTGQELPTQVAGIVLAGATLGVSKVTELLKSPEAVASKITEGAASFGKIVASGNFAGMLSDKISTGLQGVSAGLDGLANKAVGFLTGGITSTLNKAQSLFGNMVSNLAGIAQNAFNVAEKSFGNLKAGTANILGPSSSTASTAQLTQQLSGLTSQSSILEQKLNDAKAQLAKTGTDAALSAVKEAENAVAGVKQQISQVSSSILNFNPLSSISAAAGNFATGLTDKVKGFFSNSSAQDVKSLANSVASGKFNFPTTENSGINAIPGGLGSFANELSTKAGNAIEGLKTAAGNLFDNASSALGSLADPGKLVGNLVGNAQEAFSSLASNVTSSITNGISSLTEKFSDPSALISNFAGAAIGKIFGGFGKAKANLASIGNEPSQIKAPTLATNTFKAEAAITAKTGALLGDPRVPQPTFDKPVIFDVSTYQKEQSTALAEITNLDESRTTKLANLSTVTEKYNNTEQPALLAEMNALRKEIDALDVQITAAQTRYNYLINNA